jgi:hypothetical protein
LINSFRASLHTAQPRTRLCIGHDWQIEERLLACSEGTKERFFILLAIKLKKEAALATETPGEALPLRLIK